MSMKIWHIKRHTHPDWDEYSDFVIVAPDETTARDLAHGTAAQYVLDMMSEDSEYYAGHYCHEFKDPAKHTLVCLGNYNYEGRTPLPHVVCESFHAG